MLEERKSELLNKKAQIDELKEHVDELKAPSFERKQIWNRNGCSHTDKMSEELDEVIQEWVKGDAHQMGCTADHCSTRGDGLCSGRSHAERDKHPSLGKMHNPWTDNTCAQKIAHLWKPICRNECEKFVNGEEYTATTAFSIVQRRAYLVFDPARCSGEDFWDTVKDLHEAARARRLEALKPHVATAAEKARWAEEAEERERRAFKSMTSDNKS